MKEDPKTPIRADWLPRICPEVQRLAVRNKRVSWREVQQLRLNSYEREALIPNYSVDCLLRAVAECLKNCQQPSTRPYATYDEVMTGLYVPELLKQLGKLSGAGFDK